MIVRRTLILLAIFVLLAWLMAAVAARSHDDGDWVQRGNFKNAIGELCCGKRDCAALADDDVMTLRDGFYIRSLKETVPYSEATPAPVEAGGKYWRCAWGGKRKCFFAPPGSG